MARSRTYTIDRFLGINEAPDGDTGLRLGEAAEMLNFRITAEGNLQIRPGYKAVTTLSATHPVRGMWHGYIDGGDVWLAACNGTIYKISPTLLAATSIGTMTDAETSFFAFSNKVYILNGHEYKSWDGTTFADVAGYVPIVIMEAAPATGTGTTNEQVNKLIASQYIWYSGTTSTTIYQLPATSITSVDAVYVGDVLQTVTTDYTVNTSAGTVTFTSAPGAGTNNVKIRYTKNTSDTAANRTLILSQLYSETYNGYTDNRVFLYGDGTNKAYYSGLEYVSGQPTAEYFPDLNVLDVGEENAPITCLIRNFNKLLIYKKNSTWLTYYETEMLADGSVTAGFKTRAIEKEIGNEAPGQVRLVNNYPFSLQGNSVYRWGLIYSSGTQDERAAKRISDRVRETLGGLDMPSAITFDDEWNREYWILEDGTACVYQYANEAQGDTSYKQNVWYIYTAIPATCFVSINGETYFGSDDGYIMHMSRDYHSDNGANINAYWESGAMAFDAMQLYKYARQISVGIKPESGAYVTLAAETDDRSDYDENIVSSGVATFTHTNFAHFSFNTNYKPKTQKIRIPLTRFAYCKIIFKSESASATATITAFTIPISYGIYAK